MDARIERKPREKRDRARQMRVSSIYVIKRLRKRAAAATSTGYAHIGVQD
jgi:hypothetical protein